MMMHRRDEKMDGHKFCHACGARFPPQFQSREYSVFWAHQARGCITTIYQYWKFGLNLPPHVTEYMDGAWRGYVVAERAIERGSTRRKTFHMNLPSVSVQ